MAIRSVQNLINQLKEFEGKLKVYDSKRSSIFCNVIYPHNRFWETLQIECENLGHKMATYSCECCKKKFNVGTTKFPNRLLEKEQKEFLCDKKHIERYLEKDTSDWPCDFKAIYAKGKEENEKYLDALASVDLIEKEISIIQDKIRKIKSELHDVWELCDRALGYDKERENTFTKYQLFLNSRDFDDYYND